MSSFIGTLDAVSYMLWLSSMGLREHNAILFGVRY